jgi:LysR family transcriptional activator of nhaA
MVPLNYNQLYYFYQIALTGSIARASKAVLISSPALSMQLKELEETLGTDLFIRSGNKLILTEAGTIVFEYAKDIFKLGTELRDTLRDCKRDFGRSRIEIGCQESIPKKVSDELLSFLIEGQSRVLLREGRKDELVEMQNQYKLDLIVLNSVPDVKDHGLETKLLAREELCFVAHPKFRAMKSTYPNSLKKAPFILPSYDSSVRHKIDYFFKQHKLEVDVVAEVEDAAPELDLALKGYGLICTIRKSVQRELKEKRIIEVGSLDGAFEEIWMIAGKRKMLNPSALNAFNSFHLSWD